MAKHAILPMYFSSLNILSVKKISEQFRILLLILLFIIIGFDFSFWYHIDLWGQVSNPKSLIPIYTAVVMCNSYFCNIHTLAFDFCPCIYLEAWLSHFAFQLPILFQVMNSRPLYVFPGDPDFVSHLPSHPCLFIRS